MLPMAFVWLGQCSGGRLWIEPESEFLARSDGVAVEQWSLDSGLVIQKRIKSADEERNTPI